LVSSGHRRVDRESRRDIHSFDHLDSDDSAEQLLDVHRQPSTLPTQQIPLPNGETLRRVLASVTGAGTVPHLIALQQIADQNAGHRASPSPGYGASVHYVVAVLRAAGLYVSTPSYPLSKRRQRADNTLCHNVLAQTRTGDPQRIVMVGAHLDSVRSGPGINDNGSGVAALLEIATGLGGSPPIRNAIRFAFWGSEEDNLRGSRQYLQQLSLDALEQIILYLNLDMIASYNAGYFVLGGEGKSRETYGPRGSEQVACILVEHLARAGVVARTTSFDRESDYASFIDAGIPSGGFWAGDRKRKSKKQARRWGGQADEPFDPSYHTRRDRLSRLNQTALDRFTRAVAGSIGHFALTTHGHLS
jgi:aminopeptidase S